jgi:hypothetical protein
MPKGDEYRVRAANISALAKRESSSSSRAEFEHLAMAYLRLADQADKNAMSDIVYETPMERPQVQQQQQPQPDKDSSK